jgi:hypothetical protein
MARGPYERTFDLQDRIFTALSQRNKDGDYASPKTFAELKRELGVSDSSLFAALRPMIQDTSWTGVHIGCEVEVDERGHILHKYKLIDAEKAKTDPLPNVEIVHSRKDRKVGWRTRKLISKGSKVGRTHHVAGSQYYVRHGTIHWRDEQ